MRGNLAVMLTLAACTGWPHAGSAATAAALKSKPKKLPDIVGVTHVDGKYHLTDKDFLNEGADQILDLGSRVIKVWFHNPSKSYPFNSQWPAAESMVETARSPYFRTLIDKPFTTYIMMCFSKGRDPAYFRNGITQQQKLDERNQLYVGEFGMPENEFDPERIREMIPDVVRTALDWGCPYIVYWQLYCNELRDRTKPPPVTSNDDVRGFWLIRPDGSKAWTWDYFHELLDARGSRPQGICLFKSLAHRINCKNSKTNTDPRNGANEKGELTDESFRKLEVSGRFDPHVRHSLGQAFYGPVQRDILSRQQSNDASNRHGGRRRPGRLSY